MTSTTVQQKILVPADIGAEVVKSVQLISSSKHTDQEAGLRRLINMCLQEKSRALFDNYAVLEKVLKTLPLSQTESEVTCMLSMHFLAHLALDIRRCANIVKTINIISLAHEVLATTENCDLIEKTLWLLHNLARDDSCLCLISEQEGLIDFLVDLLNFSSPSLKLSALNTLRNLVSPSKTSQTSQKQQQIGSPAAKNQSKFCRKKGFHSVLNLLNDHERQPKEVVASAMSLLYALANGGPDTEPVLRKILIVAGALSTLVPLASSEEQTLRERAFVLLLSLSQVTNGLEKNFLDAGIVSVVIETLTNSTLPLSSRALAAIVLNNLSGSADIRLLLHFTGACSVISSMLESDDLKNVTTIIQLVGNLAQDETLRLELLSSHASERLKQILANAQQNNSNALGEAGTAKLLRAIDITMAIIYTPVSASKKAEIMKAALARISQLQDGSEESSSNSPSSTRFQRNSSSCKTISPSPLQNQHSQAQQQNSNSPPQFKVTTPSDSPSTATRSSTTSSSGWIFGKAAPTERRPSKAAPVMASNSPPGLLSVASEANTSSNAGTSPPPTSTSFRSTRRSIIIGSSDPELTDKLKKVSKLNGLRQKRGYIAKEIFTSERSYVHCLELCIKHYAEPLMSNSLVDQKTVQALFGNISDIYLLNSGFLMVLESRMKDWGPQTQLGDVFSSFWKTEMERLYTKYIQGLDDALEVYYKLMEENSSFKEFVANTVKVTNQDLASFLVMPVQRIPRYILLLKSLLQRTPPMHPDGVSLNRALSEAKQLTDRINEEKRHHENLQKVEKLEATIDSLPSGMKLVSPTRTFVKQGLLLEVDSEKGSIYRFVILLSDILLISTQIKKKIRVEKILSLLAINVESIDNTQENQAALTPLPPQQTATPISPSSTNSEPTETTIEFNTNNDATSSQQNEGLSNALRLLTSSGPITLSASSITERDEWVETIIETKKINFNAK